MENKINIAEILKDCPKGMRLYSPIFGECELFRVDEDSFPIGVTTSRDGGVSWFSSYGCYSIHEGAECLLFPSKDCRTWEGFKKPKPKPEFKPFDRVLARDGENSRWRCDIFSHYNNKDCDGYRFRCVGYTWKQCVPYNEQTAHLLGTTEEYKEE